MTFATYETSVDSSQPVELFRVALGSETFLYTSGMQEVTVSGDTYTPEAIKRGGVSIGPDQRNRVLTLEVPGTNALALRYVGTPPGNKAIVTILRYQNLDSGQETKLIYKGSILSSQFVDDGTIAKINCQSIEAAVSRQIPRYTYASMCGHILYDSLCGVNAASFSHLGAVSSATGDQIVVGGLGATGRDYTGGYCKPTAFSDFRMIVAHSVDTLTLLLPFEKSPVGGNVQVFAGCDHLLTGDCNVVFNNVNEFGGYAYVPNRNPFTSGLG